jgi:hypothetical protein
MLLVSSGVVGALLVGGMILLFIASWYFNHKTKIPEGCKIESSKECMGCSNILCASRKNPVEEEEKEEIVKTIDMDREVKEHLKEYDEKK